MITSMSVPSELDTKENYTAYTVGTNSLGSQEIVKLWIPGMMTEMDKEDTPQIRTKKSDPMKANILNAKSCKPKFNTTHKAANYVEAFRENGVDWDSRRIKDAGDNGIVLNNTKFECNFVHGKMSKLTYNTRTFPNGT